MKQDTAAKTLLIASTFYFGLALTLGLLVAIKFVVLPLVKLNIIATAHAHDAY